jgi:hypothetical protein
MDRGGGKFATCVGLIGLRDPRDHLAAAKDGEPLNAAVRPRVPGHGPQR